MEYKLSVRKPGILIPINRGHSPIKKRFFYFGKQTGLKSYTYSTKKTPGACASILGVTTIKLRIHNGQKIRRSQRHDGPIFFTFPPRLGGCTEICLDECVPLGLPDALSRAILSFKRLPQATSTKDRLLKRNVTRGRPRTGQTNFILSQTRFHRP